MGKKDNNLNIEMPEALWKDRKHTFLGLPLSLLGID